MARLNRYSLPNAALSLVTAIVLLTLALVSRAEEASETKKITFDDLKFAIKKDESFKREMLGEKIEALSGKSVVIRGWISPTSVFEAKGIKRFILVQDIFEKNFGPDKPLCEFIVVDLKPGQTIDYTTRPVTVEGSFVIRELKLDGKLYAVYHIEATSVTIVATGAK